MINSNIAMGAQPVQIENPMNALAKMMQIKHAMQENQMGQMKMDEYNRSAQEGKQLNALYASSLENGKVNKNKLYESMAQGGFGSKIAAMQKQDAELQESRGKAREYDDKAIDSAFKRSKDMLAGVTTPQQYIAWHESNHSDPHLGPYLAGRGVTADQSRAKIMEALQQPNGLQTLISQSSMGMDKFTERNTQSADNKASNNQSNTNSLRTAKTAANGQAITRENTQATMSKPFEVTGPDGQPTLVQQDKQGNIKPVQGYSAKTIADKPLNDAQSKALLFGSRMRDADTALKNLSIDGTETSIPGARLPVVGGVVNAFSSENTQALDQAKRDFINAVLRRESGAAIASSEFDNAEKQYFPQIGDSDKVRKQKARNRDLATRGVLMEVPEKKRESLAPSVEQSSSGFKYVGKAE